MTLKTIILIIITLICGVFLYINMDKNKENNEYIHAKDVGISQERGPITEEELEEGTYFHQDKSSKAEGTPDNWIYLDEGTRSAAWWSPDKLDWYENKDVGIEKPWWQIHEEKLGEAIENEKITDNQI